MQCSIITGTGVYIPAVIKKNEDFGADGFYDGKHQRINQPVSLIREKFTQITGIAERRYAPDNIVASDMAAFAAKEAIVESMTDIEEIDQIIVAHNYGDILVNTIQTDSVPSLASRVKNKLGIHNPYCIAYDVLFGCPGWLQGMIQADLYLKAGAAKKCLVIGTETLSRVTDYSDRDGMIFSDGAGACMIEAHDIDDKRGILSTAARSDCRDEAFYIDFGQSHAPDLNGNRRFIKMNGRKVYEYALRHVPEAMKECLDKSGVNIHSLKKIFIHQANEKMDDAIVKAFYQLHGIDNPPAYVMPMSIHWLGNSSVATIPTLYDLVRKGKIENQELHAGDIIMFASVGAGMNINAACYRY
ncbi:MAG: ketoacyl-ACP synthase III [Chitinophagaceae bacterium]